MPISVVMPALEIAQETGKLVAWRKREGESVVKGEILLEVETDKALMEIEAEGDGILAGVRVQEGAVVPVGRTIAWIVSPGETPPEEAPPEETPVAEPAVRSMAPAPPALPDLKISPKARRLARERGVDLSTLRGSGPAGEILVADVDAAAAPSSTIGRLMAERMTQSWTSVPHFFVVREIDAGALLKEREKLGAGFTHTDVLVALVARVLVRHPRLNASWSEAGIRHHAAVNISIAIAVPEGVVAPVIGNANHLDLAQIAAQRRDLTERARAGRLRPADLADGTFTISNLGMYGVDAFSAIITPPQAAVLAVGSIADRVVAIQGMPAVRPMMTLTLSSDHRVVDGAKAAEFLRDLAEAIRQPALLLPGNPQ